MNYSLTTTEPRVDAFTSEVIRSAVVAITAEMKTNLQRTAYNQIIYEAEDFTVGLFDAEGNTISIGLGLPMFIRGLSDAIKAKLEFWGKENIEPGDILLTNDGYVMGSHLNHMIFTVPVFNDGELVAFSSSMAHWPDVGGVLGGITRDIYSEGIQLPFVKIYKAGRQDPELTSIIRANVRLPERAMGDFRAQIASIRTGERRLLQLLKRYGNQAFKESVALVFEQSERLARAAVREIPDGVYEAESFMDDDGVNIGKHIPVKVRVEVQGDEMTVDLSGVAPQVAGFFNSGPTAGRSAVQVAFKCLTTPLLLPINDGALRPVKVVLPPGRVVSATKPASMRAWMTVPMTVVDTIFKALATACPERVIAGHHCDLSSAHAYGFIDASGRIFLARSGNVGSGVRSEIRVLMPAMYQSRIERTQCAPWGLLGGKDGLANRVGIIRAGDAVERFSTGKVGPLRLEQGEGFITEMGGGGGFGDPLERAPERVLADVRAGYVSLEAAARDHGVVIHQHGRRFELDVKATEGLRERMSSCSERNKDVARWTKPSASIPSPLAGEGKGEG